MSSSERLVHVVEDDAAVRRSLERLLDAAGFACRSYGSPLDALEALPRAAGGCALVDVRMPGMDGLQLQGRLAALGVTLPIIVMTGHGDVQTAVRAMKAGAADFIEKPFDDARLLSAIETALKGARPRDNALETTDAARRIANLSPRERQVLDALVAGQPNKQIAAELGISPRTVEVHRVRMLERLGVRKLAEAIRLSVMAALEP